jgi:signal transduction histidine kinase
VRRLGIGARYALYFSVPVLVVVVLALLAAGLVAWRQAKAFRQEIDGVVLAARSADAETALRGTAVYLGNRLFNDLHRVDVERLDEEISKAKAWLHVKSFLVTDAKGTVLTDGTDGKSRFGEALSGALPREATPAGVLLVPRGDETEVRFVIRSGEIVAGFGVVTIAEAPWQHSLRRLDARTRDIWDGYRASLLSLGGVGLLLALLVGLVASGILSRSLARPLMEMSHAAREIAGGNLDYRVDPEGAEEVRDLANALNGMARDLRSHERALQAERADLARKNAELERFNHTVSHDLRSPLTTIRVFAGLLEKSFAARDEERFRSDLLRVLSASDRMRELLEDLLRLSRAGRVVDRASEVELAQVARDAVELLRGRLDERGVRVEIADGLPRVRGDRHRLIDVFQNLVENAAKFTVGQAEPRIEIGAVTDARGLVVFVRDNGRGIERQHQDKVFDLFEKLDPGREGTGVGLALVKRIVEAHGGRVWVESEGEGRGATFCLTLLLAGGGGPAGSAQPGGAVAAAGASAIDRPERPRPPGLPVPPA